MTSLGNKITIALLTAILVVMTLEGYFSFQRVRRSLLADIQREVASISRIVRATLESVGEAALSSRFEQLAPYVQDTERLLGLALYDRGGQVIALSPSLQGHALPEADITHIMTSRTPVEGLWRDHTASRYYRIEPLYNSQAQGIAAVLLLEDVSFFSRELRVQACYIGGVTFGLFVLLTGLVVLIIRQGITQPLQGFTQHLGQLGQGQVDLRAHASRRDELGRLAQAIDRVWDRVAAAQQQALMETAEKLRLERALRQSERFVALGQLASRLAHEIGTPLNIIKGRAQQLQQRATLTEKERSFLTAIVSQIERISRFIRQLLTLARRPEPRFRILSVNDVVRRSWEVIGDRGADSGVEMTLDLADNLPPILGDADQLQEVLLNLTTNALQAVGTTGRVLLSTRVRQNSDGEQPQTVEIIVRDTGPGIAPEDLPHVFEPFFTTKGAIGGSGMGLPISREIVHSHCGEISITSEPGRGTCVVVALPAADRQQASVPQPAVIAQGHSS
ncbi:MAG TPA: ATP-binding protein [Methylomirabilota bacterium]|jgi:signal transduction histidine kinase|nr:ATP-binding protein [Methylomirabilota bacterium]